MMRKVCLVIIDGFGVSNKFHGNATTAAKFIDKKKLTSKWIKLKASGKYVGLPEGYSGNSEVGHMTIGAGRRIEQSLLCINRYWNTGIFTSRINKLSLATRVHIVGLLSNGGVHSHIDHLKHLLAVVPGDVFVHTIADGIDTPPDQFFKFLSSINCRVATISGRYYAMDRDGNDERVTSVFNAMTAEEYPVNLLDLDNPSSKSFDIKKSISNFPNITKKERNRFIDYKYADEYIPPVRLVQDRIKPEDAIIFYNFRADRMRQLVKLFKKYKHVYTMTDYGLDDTVNVIFRTQKPLNTLAEWLEKHSLTQAHIAETEKYAHVTYFFNGGDETLLSGETRFLVKSPSVNGFDETPETAMNEVKSKCINAINLGFDFIVINLAAPDLVGHSGNFEAAIKAVKTADEIVKELHQFCSKTGYMLMITGDHGNSEQMEKNKSHTTNDVPLLLIGAASGIELLSEDSMDNPGELADIAPTILDLMGIPAPDEMTGRSLIRKDN
ncbi:2,3-bisphosphoglycerate-independent phosphoglycerate mutase [Pancytospora epiphaga]|nr:2,3-bisphosphoglycerate-independent phosphoglycerate mutase [Pancytospora epiphaga]